jgi:hypothetical protein
MECVWCPGKGGASRGKGWWCQSLRRHSRACRLYLCFQHTVEVRFASWALNLMLCWLCVLYLCTQLHPLRSTPSSASLLCTAWATSAATGAHCLHHAAGLTGVLIGPYWDSWEANCMVQAVSHLAHLVMVSKSIGQLGVNGKTREP